MCSMTLVRCSGVTGSNGEKTLAFRPDWTVAVVTPTFARVFPIATFPPKIPIEPVSGAGCATMPSAGIEM